MAKKKGRPPSSGRIEKAAETVGGALGSVMARVDAWMAQREEIAKELRAAADRIMSGENPLSGGAAFRVPGGSARPAERPKKRRRRSASKKSAKKLKKGV